MCWKMPIRTEPKQELNQTEWKKKRIQQYYLYFLSRPASFTKEPGDLYRANDKDVTYANLHPFRKLPYTPRLAIRVPPKSPHQQLTLTNIAEYEYDWQHRRIVKREVENEVKKEIEKNHKTLSITRIGNSKCQRQWMLLVFYSVKVREERYSLKKGNTAIRHVCA